MKASIRVDHKLLAIETEHSVYAMLELEAPPAPEKKRPALNLALVLDRSGSMTGPKLEVAKRCARYLVQRLAPDDKLALITYDDEVDLLASLAPVEAWLDVAIASIYPGGCTNLSGGWLKGLEELRRAEKGQPCKVLLLTDGLANEGVTDPAQLTKMAAEAARAGIGTTTIGFGDGFDENLLTAMADAGGGNSHYAETPEAAPGIFAKEFEGLVSIVAQNVSVEIRPTKDVKVLRVLNQYPHTLIAGGVQVNLGDAYGAERRKVIFELHIPRMAALGAKKVADIVLRYVSIGDEIATHEVTIPLKVNLVSADEAAAQAPDAEVTEEVLVLKAAHAEDEARKLADSGDYDAAQRVLAEAADELRRKSTHARYRSRLEAEAENLLRYSADMMAGTYSAMQAKRMAYSSYQARRSRGRPDEMLWRMLQRAAHQQVSARRVAAAGKGALVGVAVGNALGIPFESVSKDAIAGFLQGQPLEVDTRERERPWDDDVAQTVLLAETLLEHGGFDRAAFLAKLVRWADDNGRGMGGLTRAVIAQARSGVADPAGAAWEASRRQSAGNGAVMRFAPVALAFRLDAPLLVDVARQQAAATHADPRCIWSTVAVTVALAATISEAQVPLDYLADALEFAGAPDEVVLGIRAVPSAGLEDFELDQRASMGYTVKAMQVGLWCLEQPKDFESVMTQVITAGGDTDTNGAVAGAFMGARCGKDAIPQRWIENIGRLHELEALADRLLAQ